MFCTRSLIQRLLRGLILTVLYASPCNPFWRYALLFSIYTGITKVIVRVLLNDRFDQIMRLRSSNSPKLLLPQYLLIWIAARKLFELIQKILLLSPNLWTNTYSLLVCLNILHAVGLLAVCSTTIESCLSRICFLSPSVWLKIWVYDTKKQKLVMLVEILCGKYKYS